MNSALHHDDLDFLAKPPNFVVFAQITIAGETGFNLSAEGATAPETLRQMNRLGERKLWRAEVGIKPAAHRRRKQLGAFVTQKRKLSGS